MTTGDAAKLYDIDFEHPEGDPCLRVDMVMADGVRQCLFHSRNDVTVRAEGIFAQAPQGFHLVELLLHVAEMKRPGGGFFWKELPLTDAEIMKLVVSAARYEMAA